MSITTRRKADVIKTHAIKAGDTGSPEVQAILSSASPASLSISRPTSRTTIPGVDCSLRPSVPAPRLSRPYRRSGYKSLIERLGIRR
jgi:small subunit ribosomal protein S15